MDQLYREVLLLLLASPPERECRRDVQELFYQLGPRRCQAFDIRNGLILEGKLRICSELFQVEKNRSDIPTVAPKTSLTICRAHSNKSGSCPEGTCPDLHLCVFELLSGGCGYGARCLFGHDIRTPHNQGLLRRHRLQGVNATDLRTLFALPGVRQGVMLPGVCTFYNKMKGCAKGQNCRSLHLCSHYVQDQCKFARRCERNHNIDHPQVIEVLTLYGVKVRNQKKSDLLQEVRFYDKKRAAQNDVDHCNDNHGDRIGSRSRLGFTRSGATPKRSGSVPNLLSGQKLSFPGQGSAHRAPSADRRPRTCSESAYTKLAGPRPGKIEEICVYELKGSCHNKEKCSWLHSNAPYLWRLQALDTGAADCVWSGGSEWNNLPPDSNRQLENVYCRPLEMECAVTDHDGDEITVTFRYMTALKTSTGQKYKVRRVSTKSTMVPGLKESPPSNPHREFATEWLWYWRNQDSRWSEFGREENDMLPITSSLVEENFQMNPSTPMTFGVFVLDFGKMRLKDVDEGHKFRVRRRPRPPPVENHVAAPSVGDPESDSDSDTHRENCNDEEEDKDDEARAPSDLFDYDDIDDGGKAADLFSSPASRDNFLSPIHAHSKKFQEIKSKFIGTLGVASTVLRIHTVNNPQLKAKYQRKKSSLKSKPRHQAKQPPCFKELRLFYGPSPSQDIDSVSKHGPDCDKTGEYGKGGHFHVNAARAHRHNGEAIPGGGKRERCVFLVKCLVVSSLIGSDWVADDRLNPKTYVVSNPCLVCPEFAVTYQLA